MQPPIPNHPKADEQAWLDFELGRFKLDCACLPKHASTNEIESQAQQSMSAGFIS